MTSARGDKMKGIVSNVYNLTLYSNILLFFYQLFSHNKTKENLKSPVKVIEVLYLTHMIKLKHSSVLVTEMLQPLQKVVIHCISDTLHEV